MSSYRFTGVVYVDLGKIKFGTHIPYFLCSEVVGPKGGTYVLDEFCTWQLLKSLTKDVSVRYVSLLAEAVSSGKLKRTNIKLNEDSSDLNVKKYASQIKAKPLIRKEGLATVQNMLVNFDRSFLSK